MCSFVFCFVWTYVCFLWTSLKCAVNGGLFFYDVVCHMWEPVMFCHNWLWMNVLKICHEWSSDLFVFSHCSWSSTFQFSWTSSKCLRLSESPLSMLQYYLSYERVFLFCCAWLWNTFAHSVCLCVSVRFVCDLWTSFRKREKRGESLLFYLLLFRFINQYKRSIWCCCGFDLLETVIDVTEVSRINVWKTGVILYEYECKPGIFIVSWFNCVWNSRSLVYVASWFKISKIKRIIWCK